VTLYLSDAMAGKPIAQVGAIPVAIVDTSTDILFGEAVVDAEMADVVAVAFDAECIVANVTDADGPAPVVVFAYDASSSTTTLPVRMRAAFSSRRGAARYAKGLEASARLAPLRVGARVQARLGTVR
jgi:hypothetical protein